MDKKFDIPKNSPGALCKSCRARVFWIITTKGKKMPCNPDGTSHFATCPDAAQFRRHV
jgi:hypothetical protein